MSLSMSAISVNAADPAATVPAKDAVIDGFSLKDTADEKPIEFLEDKNAIVGVSETSSAVYTVPEDFEGGNYDVYLQISKIASPFIGSSTPVTVSVNGGDVYVPTMREECFAPSEDAPEKSFVDEMGKMIGKDKHFDLFIVQLSTNDATGDIPMGEISDGEELEDFDTATVIGAMEYIVKYAMDTWNCPVMFYTGTQYDSEQYGEMVKATLELQKKWDFGLIDLWNNDEMNAVSEEDYEKYMKDGIHPNRTGYVEWWTPQFEAAIIDYLK